MKEPKFKVLTNEEAIEAARNDYGHDDIMVDHDAKFSRVDDGVWVQGWLWVGYKEEEETDAELVHE